MSLTSCGVRSFFAFRRRLIPYTQSELQLVSTRTEQLESGTETAMTLHKQLFLFSKPNTQNTKSA
jgi:hypothetical protein